MHSRPGNEAGKRRNLPRSVTCETIKSALEVVEVTFPVIPQSKAGDLHFPPVLTLVGENAQQPSGDTLELVVAAVAEELCL